MKKPLLPLLLAALPFFTMCNSSEKGIEIVEPVDSDTLIERTNAMTLSDTTGEFISTAGAPTIWQSFEAFFKTCVKNSQIKDYGLFSKYDLLYLGPTNAKYLGTIYSSNGVETKTELTQWVSPDEMSKFISKGIPVPSCDISQVKEQFISIALGRIPFNNSDSTLKFVLSNRDTIVNSVGSWTIDEIRTSDFIKYINENASKPDIKFYKDVLTQKNNVVAFKVVKVSGFQADLKYRNDLNIGVNLNIPITATRAVSGADSILCNLRFTRTDNKTVHMESNGEFYAFALVMKGKKVN